MNPSQNSVDLDQYWQIVKRHWLPGSVVFLSILTLGVIATSLKENVYQAEAKLKFKQNTVTGTLSDVGKVLEGFSPIADRGNPIATEAEVLRSVPLIKQTIEDPQLSLRNSEGQKLSVNAFARRLKVGSLPSTDILKVSYSSKSPEQAAKIVNTLVRNYLQNNQVVNTAEAVAAREFLELQLPKVEKSLRETEAQIREIKESNEFINPAEDTRALITSQQELEDEIVRTRGELANAESQANYIREKLGLTTQEAFVLSTIGQSSEIRSTLDRLEEAESQLSVAQTKFTDNSPNIIDLKNEINSFKNRLKKQAAAVGGANAVEILLNNKSGVVQQELTSQLIRLEARNDGLKKQLVSLEGLADSRRAKIKKVPQLEEKLSKLERQARSYQSSYDVLWNQLETVKIAESQDLGNVRVISNAVVPTTPVSSRGVGYLASASLASLAAAGVIYLLEISDKSIRTIEEAKQLYGYTWLGVIPSTDNVDRLSLPEAGDRDPTIPKLVVRDYPSLPLSESYRMLQSNIKFLNSDRIAKTIVITSSAAQEGKSTVAANLAAAMAQVGNKVLLVDANLHAPNQHRIWDRYNNSGLSNVISEQLDPRMTIDEVMPNLDLLTSGTATLSPATLLDSQRMRMLMDYWSERYDFVIFDTPSLDMTADAPIMGRMADGVLLVVRPGFVERSQATFTKEMLAQSGINILGIIFNGITPQFESTPFYYQALASQQAVEEQNRLTESRAADSKGELWDAISSISRESNKNKLNGNLGEKELQVAPLEKLEAMVQSLQQDLGDLDLLVREQEEELLSQRQKVKKLQRQANVATENERFYLENQLNQEQERKRMLDETLVGQKRNLEKRREVLYRYQQILASRKKASTQIL